MINIAALKAVNPNRFADGESVWVSGYYAAYDGGGGIYTYDADSAAADDAGAVIAPTAGSGRYLAVFDDDVSVKRFGAKGDNVANDSAAILAAGAYSIANGRTVYVPKGTYKIGTLLVFSGALRMYGDGESSIFDFSAYATPSAAAITLGGSASATTTTLSSSAALGATSLSVGSATGFAAGDMVKITSTEPFGVFDTNYLKGELAYVDSTSTGTIVLRQGTRDSYTVSPYVVTITKIVPATAPSVRNIYMLGGGAAKTQYAINCNYSIRPEFSGISIKDFEDSGISLSYVDCGRIENCHAHNMPGTANGVGYAFGCDLLTQSSIVRNCTTENVSCGFSTGGYYPVRFCVCDGNRFQKGTSLRPMIQTHINGTGIVVSNNTLINGVTAIGMFGPRNTIIGNIIEGMSYAGIYVTEDGGYSVQVIGNKVKAYRGISVQMPSASAGSAIIADNDLIGSPTLAVADGIGCGAFCTVRGNRIRNHSPGIRCNDGDYTLIDGNEIVDVRDDNQAYGIYLYTDTTSVGARLCNNRIRSGITSEMTYGIVIAANVEDSEIRENFIFNATSSAVSDAGTRSVFVANNISGNRQIRYVDSSIGVAAGTTSGKAKSTNTATFCIDGFYASKSATDDLWDLTSVVTLGSQYKKVVLCLDSSGNASIVEGSPAASQAAAALPWFIPLGACPVAIVEIPNNYSGGSISGYAMHNIVGLF